MQKTGVEWHLCGTQARVELKSANDREVKLQQLMTGSHNQILPFTDTEHTLPSVKEYKSL